MARFEVTRNVGLTITPIPGFCAAFISVATDPEFTIQPLSSIASMTTAKTMTHEHVWVKHEPATIGARPVWACACGLWQTQPLKTGITHG